MTLWWIIQRYQFNVSNGVRGSSPTSLYFQILYGMFGVLSLIHLEGGVYFFVVNGWGAGGIMLVLLGFVQGCPILAVLLIGRKQLFNLMGRRFEEAHALHDSAFIAELLDQAVAKQGHAWWVHRNIPDERFEEQFDPRRNWRKGTVEKVLENEIVVTLPVVDPGPEELEREHGSGIAYGLGLEGLGQGLGHLANATRLSGLWGGRQQGQQLQGQTSRARVMPYTIVHHHHHAPNVTRHHFPIASHGLNANELMSKAVVELRCIEWANVTQELMMPSFKGKIIPLNELSRPVRQGEQIDFFMSHRFVRSLLFAVWRILSFGRRGISDLTSLVRALLAKHFA
jgi:hypothetical protein